LDPFTGSSTTGISANLLNRRFLGIDKESAILKVATIVIWGFYSLTVYHSFADGFLCFTSKKDFFMRIRQRFGLFFMQYKH
jgi:site-specific DNA-methyltransferase (adenine-specific)